VLGRGQWEADALRDIVREYAVETLADPDAVLRRAGKGYVLGVAGTRRFHAWGKAAPLAGTAEAIAASRPAADWQRLSAGAVTKGPRLHEWCHAALAYIEAGEFGGAEGEVWTRGLPIQIILPFRVPRRWF